MYKKFGFTFVELIVVVAIILILSVMILPKLTGKTTEAKNKATEGMLVSIASSLSMVKMDNPSVTLYCKLEDLDNPQASPPTEDAGSNPATFSNWNGPYIVYNHTSGGTSATVPDDSWRNDYVLDVSTVSAQGYATIKSYGKDGVDGGGDDIEHKFF